MTALFKWYKDDFRGDAGTEQKFLAKFIDDKALKEKVLATKKLEFIKYNWQLNKQGNFEKSNAKKDWTATE